MLAALVKKLNEPLCACITPLCLNVEDYKEWAWKNHHRGFMQPWASITAAFLVLILRDIIGLCPRIVTFGMFCTAVAIIAITASCLPVNIEPRLWTHRALVTFSALQILVTWLVSFGAGDAPSQNRVCSWHLDVLTNLYVSVPTLAVADFSVGGWLLFLLLHILSSTPYFALVLGYPLPLSVLKVSLIQGLALIMYAEMEKIKIATFVRLQPQHQQQLLQQQEQQQQQLSPQKVREKCKGGSNTGAASSQTCEAGGVGSAQQAQRGCEALGCREGYERANALKLKAAGGMSSAGVRLLQAGVREGGALGQGYSGSGSSTCSSTTMSSDTPCMALALALTRQRQQPQQQLPPPEPLPISCKDYVSAIRRHQVHVKIHASIDPSEVHAHAASQLAAAFANRRPGTGVVGMAVRHGCVILSINLCELRQLAHERREGREGFPGGLIQAIIQDWLQASGLQELMAHGTQLGIQMEGTVLKCQWDAHTRTWELQNGAVLTDLCWYSIGVPSIVLHHPAAPAPPPPEPQPALPQAQPPQPEQPPQLPQQAQEAQAPPRLAFKAYITTPYDADIVGWPGRAQEGEAAFDEQPQEHALQLLVHTQGRFLPTEVQQLEGRDCMGGQVVQVSILLPAAVLAQDCCQLRLQLARGSHQLCSYNTMLVSPRLAPEMQELKAWAKPPRAPSQISAFVEDLAEWLSPQSLARAPDAAPAHARAATPVGATAHSAGAGDGTDAGLPRSRHEGAGGVVPVSSLLPVLVAEAHRPEMVQMMGEVGLDLLQHAVSWGMVALADRIMAGLMAPPLSAPFPILASGSAPMRSPDQPPRSLLTCALLSDDARMLAQTLTWGHVHGGRGFVWGVHEAGLDTDLLKVVQALPSSHQLLPSQAPMLRMLLADPLAAPLARHALDPLAAPAPGACAERPQLQQQQQEGARQPPIAPPVALGATCTAPARAEMDAAAVTAAVTTAAAAAAAAGTAGSVVACATTPAGALTGTPAAQPQRPASASRFLTQALVMGFGEEGDVNESGYRSWSLTSSRTSLAHMCCLGVLPYFWLIAAQIAYHGLAMSAVVMAAYPLPMLLALLTKAPRRRERFMCWAKVAHYAIYLVFGLGLLPTIVARKPVLTYVDLLVEVVIYRFMEQCVFVPILQVQLRALLLERAASAMGSALLYARLGIPHPLLQALAINVASVCVGVALDVRNRRLYVRLHRAGALPLPGGPTGAGKKVQ